MKRSIWAAGMLGAVLSAVGPGIAMAQVACPTAPYTTSKSTSDIEAVVNGNMACYPSNGPHWTNQEWHSGAGSASTGTITDYKLGPGAPNDPSLQIGTYSIQNNQIQYLYYVPGTMNPGGPTFTYTLWGTNGSDSVGNYQLCNVNTPGAPLTVGIISGGPEPCHGVQAP